MLSHLCCALAPSLHYQPTFCHLYRITAQSEQLPIGMLFEGETLFSHTPLDLSSPSIRLLEVLPGRSKDGRIRCTIRNSTISDEYTCLSYVWGSSEGLKKHKLIEINDGIFEVRTNLWSFLDLASSERARHNNLRLPSTYDEVFDFEAVAKSLWIDALCIDQGNLAERNAQVQQMGAIYKNAKHVISWLGRSEHAAPLLRRIRHEEGPHADETLLPSITWFESNAYWTRAWITQEILLAQHLIIAAEEDAVIGRTVLEYFRRLPDPLRPHADSQCQTLLRSHVQSQTWTLLNHLSMFRDKGCTNPRDKVYSLLSVCRDTEWLKVDYNITKGRLAIDVMRNCDGFCLCVAEVTLSAMFTEEPLSALHFAAFEGVEVSPCAPTCAGCHEWLDVEFVEEELGDAMMFCFCLTCQHGAFDGGDVVPIRYGHLVIVRSKSRGLKTYHFRRDGQGVSRMYGDVTGNIPPQSVSGFYEIQRDDVPIKSEAGPRHLEQCSSTAVQSNKRGSPSRTHTGYIDLLGLWYLARLGSWHDREDDHGPTKQMQDWKKLHGDMVLNKHPLQSQQWILPTY